MTSARRKREMGVGMKKSTVRVTVVFVVLIVGVLAYFAYLSGKSRDAAAEAQMTAVQLVLSRDMQNNYPSTVKEVVKYYTEIQKCFYAEGCTDEELEQLGLRARELYDEELLANNDVDSNLLQLKAEVAAFRNDKKQMTSVSVANSINVDTFTQDGYDFARIQCTYNVVEGGKSTRVPTIYLLRRDENRRWKIYGWDLAENVNPR